MEKQISESTLIKRINRRLAHKYEQLKKSRSPLHPELGEYYIVNNYFNTIDAFHVDPEGLGRELGALRDDEQVQLNN